MKSSKLFKRIGAAVLAVATAAVLIPWGTRSAKAETYSRDDFSAICIMMDGTVDNNGTKYVFDDDVVCGFYGSVTFDDVEVYPETKTVVFYNLSTTTELSIAKTDWVIQFNGDCSATITLEEGSILVDVAPGGTFTGKIQDGPGGVRIADGLEMSPEGASFNPSDATEITLTRAAAKRVDNETGIQYPEDNFMAGSLDGEFDDIADAILTEEEKAAVAAGAKLVISFETSDATATLGADEKKAIEDATASLDGSYQIATFTNIHIYKQIGNGAKTEVTNTNAALTFIATVPEAYRKEGRTFKWVRLHGTTTTVLDGTYNAETGELKGSSDQYSVYAIIYSDATATTTEATTAAKAAAPKTADQASPVAVIALFGLAVVAGAASIKKIAK